MASEEKAEIETQARKWIVRLASGDMTREELAELRAWLAESGDHKAAFRRERTFWHRLGPLEAAFAAPPQASAAPAPRVLQRPRGWRRPTLGAALAMAACLLLLLFAPQILTALRADYASGPDKLREVALVDGSRVTLDRNSAIAIAFDGQARHVDLLSGNAFFDVAPDPQRPFRVTAQGGVSEAVGTAYAVEQRPQGVRVTVTEGRVAVSAEGRQEKPRLLGANESLTYGPDGRFAQQVRQADSQTLAWRDGKVIFVARPLAEALAVLQHYHPGRIVLATSRQDLRPVTGVIDLDRLDEGLAALAATHDLSLLQVTPFLTVLR